MTDEPRSRPGREKILDAAEAVFAEVGFGTARVDEIARRAGVNKAMLYYHVGDKAALYHEVVQRNVSRLNRQVDAALAGSAAPEERLRRLIAGLTGALQEMPHHPPIMLREIASGAVNLPPGDLEGIMKLIMRVDSIFEAGLETGEFRRHEPAMVSLMLLGSIVLMTATRPVRERARASGAPMPEVEAPGQVADFVCDVLLHGVLRNGGHE